MPMLQNIAVFAGLILLSASPLAAQKTVEALKTEAEHASGGHQARLYAELAQQLVDVANQQFTDAQAEQGQATVQEILKYATLARDISVRSRHKMKETEIHLRQAERRLEAVRRTLSVDDRPPLEEVEKQIEKLRKDLLDAMFAPPKKENKPS
ncbi:MAG TPA: hypothetical protein VNW97_16520 [Candidatus Saccharimonadales bacterium]|nr:hypothetical protein [Candidatus Saccharimonadales bacterium]